MDQMQGQLTASLEKAGLSKETAEGISKAIAQTTALAVGTAVGGTQGGALALNVDANNRQLTHTEAQRIKQLAKGDVKKETRLTDAACAMVKCSAEFATGSQDYISAKNSEIRGAGYTYELKQLADEQKSDSSLFSYGAWDKTVDTSKNIGNTAVRAGSKVVDLGKGVAKGAANAVKEGALTLVDGAQTGIAIFGPGQSVDNIEPVSEMGKAIEKNGLVDGTNKVVIDTLAGTSDAMKAAGQGDMEPIGEVIGGVVGPIAVGKVIGKTGSIISEDVAVVTEGNRGVRTGTYEGAAVGLDETSLLGQERSISPTQGVIRGEPEAPPSNAKPEQVRSIARQNEAAQTLSEHGFDIEQLPNNNGRTNTRQPDLRINGELADVYSPKTPNVQSVWDAVNDKANPAQIKTYQAPNVVVNLADSTLSVSDVAQFVQRNPVNGLKNLVVIKDGKVTVLTMGH
jgi:filamentous hemagglutinin